MCIRDRVVWEYINPYFKAFAGEFSCNMVYRAYRVPYEWVPQLEKPEEVSIEPVDVSTFRVPGASVGAGTGQVTAVDGIDPNKEIALTGSNDDSDEDERIDFCVASVNKSDIENIK